VPFYSDPNPKPPVQIYNFVIFVATKKGKTTNFFHTSLLLLFFGSGDPDWTKIRIQDKHLGSATATLLLSPRTKPAIQNKNSLIVPRRVSDPH
jgi:hypothetical protein